MMQSTRGLPTPTPMPLPLRGLPGILAMDVPPPAPDVVPLPPSPHPVPPPPATPPEIIEPPLPGQQPVRDPVVVPGEGFLGPARRGRRLQ